MRGKAADLFPHGTGTGFELLVKGLYGPRSRRWVPIRQVWRGNVMARLGSPEANVNFSLKEGVGWITFEPDQEIEIRKDIRA